jgi:Leucine-rich repeat (LRR) protein
VFSNLLKLKRLNLFSNYIKTIEDNAFPSSLEELNLGDNEMTELGENVFSNLVNLKDLNLGFNQDTEFNPSIFTNLVNLETLYVPSSYESFIFNSIIELYPKGIKLIYN